MSSISPLMPLSKIVAYPSANSGMITSILRFVTFFQTDLFSDPTYLVIETMTWTCVEPGVYLIAACLPSLRPLVRPLFKDIDFSTVYGNIRSMGSKAFKTHRTRTDSPLPATKETSTDSSLRSSPRDGFTKLKEPMMGYGVEIRGPDERNKSYGRQTRRGGLESEYEWHRTTS